MKPPKRLYVWVVSGMDGPTIQTYTWDRATAEDMERNGARMWDFALGGPLHLKKKKEVKREGD